jgi:hypothetical protein
VRLEGKNALFAYCRFLKAKMAGKNILNQINVVEIKKTLFIND